jgi:hypothetical protein
MFAMAPTKSPVTDRQNPIITFRQSHINCNTDVLQSSVMGCQSAHSAMGGVKFLCPVQFNTWQEIGSRTVNSLLVTVNCCKNSRILYCKLSACDSWLLWEPSQIGWLFVNMMLLPQQFFCLAITKPTAMIFGPEALVICLIP